MSKFHLPLVFGIDIAIHYLNLDTVPYAQALKIILDYSKYHELHLNFNDTVRALGSDILIGELCEYEEHESEGEIYSRVVNSEFVTEVPEIHRHDKEKTIESAYIYGKPDALRVCISSFSSEGKSYNIVNHGGSEYSDISLPISSISIHKADLLAFEARINTTDKPVAQSNSTQFTGKDKALALLALEMAHNSAKFRTVNKVNASQVKEYILELARVHLKDNDNPLKGLISMDDIINKALQHYDINDINEIPD